MPYLSSFLPFWPPLFLLFTIFLDFYDFLMILTASHSFRHVCCCHGHALFPRLAHYCHSACSLSHCLSLSGFRFRAGNNFSNFLRLFVYVSTVFGFSLGSVQLSLALALRWVSSEVGFACNSHSPRPSLCLLLMRLLTLINVFSYYLCLLPYWIWVSVAIWNSFYCSHVKWEGALRVLRVLFQELRLLNSLKISISTAARPQQ